MIRRSCCRVARSDSRARWSSDGPAVLLAPRPATVSEEVSTPAADSAEPWPACARRRLEQCCAAEPNCQHTQNGQRRRQGVISEELDDVDGGHRLPCPSEGLLTLWTQTRTVVWGANRGSSFANPGRQDWRSWRGEQQRVAPQGTRSLRVAAENTHRCVAKARRVPYPPSPSRLALRVFGPATRLCP